MKRGVIAPSLIVSYSHDDEAVDRTVEAFHGAFGVYRRALDEGIDGYLESRPVQPVWRTYNEYASDRRAPTGGFPRGGDPAQLDLRRGGEPGAGRGPGPEGREPRAKFVATPENTNYLGPHDEKVRRAQPLDGPVCSRFSELARELGLHLLLGSFNEKADDSGRCFNTSVLFGPRGDRLAVYRKIHLFDVDISPETRFAESDTIKAGRRSRRRSDGPGDGRDEHLASTCGSRGCTMSCDRAGRA